MTAKKKGTQLVFGDDSPESIIRAIGLHAPQVATHLNGQHTDFTSLFIKMRGEYDFLLVMKRYADDGGLEVCFGGGATIGSAIKNLEGSLSAGKWKADVPWEKRKGGDK